MEQLKFWTSARFICLSARHVWAKGALICIITPSEEEGICAALYLGMKENYNSHEIYNYISV